jgi:hypothetical protein
VEKSSRSLKRRGQAAYSMHAEQRASGISESHVLSLSFSSAAVWNGKPLARPATLLTIHSPNETTIKIHYQIIHTHKRGFFYVSLSAQQAMNSNYFYWHRELVRWFMCCVRQALFMGAESERTKALAALL